MKINQIKLFLPMLAYVIALLLVLTCVPDQVHAQTRVLPYQTLGTITSIQPSIRFRGNYVFSPTYITCRVYRPCVTIVNRTGNVVMLVNGYGRIVARLWPGGSFSQNYYYPGTFTITDVQHNIRVPLTVTVLEGFYPPMRYSWGWQPMQRSW